MIRVLASLFRVCLALLQQEVHNQMDVATSIHWHGTLLPNDMDGVSFVTFPPISPRWDPVVTAVRVLAKKL
jgi:FtsP/CotA-like multicopper oxidase with cupredoxin domain